ncbi:MAG: phosphate ABC transporter substrate-binding protein [Acidobacteria bacterium]|nr:phosphate ABC transporter substrate-binding protein [Acidobacteriota bacterium]MBI3662656.1 phosphate ABC transporter substrate-binding protein [Acidobacteriota bacterium]
MQVLGVTLALLAGAAIVAAQGGRNITVKGSDTMVILGQRWAEEFMKKNSGVAVQVTGGGSGVGIAALINGTTDIAEASRLMKDAEKASLKEKRGKDTLGVPVAVDGLAVYVHEQNPVNELSLAQLKGIYTGTIKNWSQVGGRDERIILYSRENSSGTYAYFKEHVLENADYYPTAQTLPGTAAVINAVSKDTRGIGYGGIAYGKGIKHLRVKKDDKSPAIEPAMENVLQGKYPISRYLYWYFAGQPAGELAKLAQWVVAPEGQKVVENVGYYPLNEKDRVASAAKLGGGTTAAAKSKPAGSK